VAGIAADLLDQVNAFDADAALDRLDHVVDRQARDRDRGQRLHLDAGRARHLDAGADDAAGQLGIGCDIDRDLAFFASRFIYQLLVEPDILHAPAVEDAVDHDRQALDIGTLASPATAVENDRPHAVVGQLAFDRP
jgi:hypothetical protein